jgi:hypothetical protein
MAAAMTEALERFSSLAASDDEAVKAAAFPALKSLLYCVRAELGGARKSITFGVVLGILDNLSLRLPYLSPERSRDPLTHEQAEREAVNLEDPRSGRTYIASADLAGLSSDEVSRLDVRRDHHVWYAESELVELRARHGTAWKALEAQLAERVSARIDERYDLDRARRVLVFDDIKSSGTSPKVDAEDLSGQSWKIKWGDEVQPEALANRLYVELGARHADLVYANKGGPADLVLVLDEPDPERAAPDCDHVSTYDELHGCLLESKYEFDVSSHVVGQGVVTEELLREPPFAGAPGEKAELVGRRFVTFNESSVELEPPAEELTRLGPAPLSSAGALDDRATRGLVLFTYWIHNKDGKDANNRGVVDRRSATFLEYVHDLGA